MQRIKLSLILGLTTLCAVLLLAQVSPVEQMERGVRAHPQQKSYIARGQDPSSGPEIRVFSINKTPYRATLDEAALWSGPDWTPSKPLPLDFAKAEAIARRELRKIVSDDSTWEVTGFHLRSVQGSTGEFENSQLLRVKNAVKWYFQVEMKSVSPLGPAGPEAAGPQSDSFWVFISLSGQAGETQTFKRP